MRRAAVEEWIASRRRRRQADERLRGSIDAPSFCARASRAIHAWSRRSAPEHSHPAFTVGGTPFGGGFYRLSSGPNIGGWSLGVTRRRIGPGKTGFGSVVVGGPGAGFEFDRIWTKSGQISAELPRIGQSSASSVELRATLANAFPNVVDFGRTPDFGQLLRGFGQVSTRSLSSTESFKCSEAPGLDPSSHPKK